MADDKLESIDVTGRWTGFYRYISDGMPPYPIAAEIIQTGSRLRGEMYDQITDVSDTLERILELRRTELPTAVAWRAYETIRQLGSKTMVVSTRLPDTSDIEGTIHGDQVEFTKFYRGTVRYQSTIRRRALQSARSNRPPRALFRAAGRRGRVHRRPMDHQTARALFSPLASEGLGLLRALQEIETVALNTLCGFPPLATIQIRQQQTTHDRRRDRAQSRRQPDYGSLEWAESHSR